MNESTSLLLLVALVKNLLNKETLFEKPDTICYISFIPSPDNLMKVVKEDNLIEKTVEENYLIDNKVEDTRLGT